MVFATGEDGEKVKRLFVTEEEEKDAILLNFSTLKTFLHDFIARIFSK